MNANDLNAAIEKISAAAIQIERDLNSEMKKSENQDQRIQAIENACDRRAKEATAQIGNVTIAATTGGNTVRHHVRITYKIDGKRASKAKVEEMIK